MMKKYCITFETENHVAVTCIKYLIENTFGNNVEINEVQEKKEQKLDVLPSLDFVTYHEGIPRPFIINYNGYSKALTKDDFIKYCTLILKKFNTNDICEQYNILKRCGISDENLFQLFDEMSMSDVESIINGHPYPYVAQQWGMIFSRVVMEADEEKENKKAFNEFKEAERNDLLKRHQDNTIKHKRIYTEISQDEKNKHSYITTWKQFIDYLNENKITNDAFYHKYGISFQIVGNIRRGILPSKRSVIKINEVFGCNIDPDFEETIVVEKKSKTGISKANTLIYVSLNSNPFEQLFKKGFRQKEIAQIFGMSDSYICNHKKDKTFRLRENTKKRVEELGRVKFIE